MSDLTYDEFYKVACASFPDDGDTRWGQHYFNLLHRLRPEIANKLRGTLHDPFHRTKVSDETQSVVIAMW